MTETIDSDPSNAYGRLGRKLYRLAAERRQPISGTFELTDRCNLDCRMCFIRRSAADPAARDAALSASQWVDMAHAAVDQGMIFLLLTGGEVLTRPDFFEIFMPLTRMGLVITLFTNGTLIDASTASRLAEAPPHCTSITLYGASEKTYETVTGVPGSYARCCAGIEALVARGVPLALKSTLTRQNVHELDAMRDMAHGWGLTFTASWMLTRRPDGHASDVENCRMTASHCITLEAGDRVSSRELRQTTQRKPAIDLMRNFYCQAGTCFFSINVRGEMSPCSLLSAPAARPLETGFKTAWEQLQRWVESAPPPASACRDCESRRYCPRCPAWSEIETGTLTEPVPYLCEIAHARRNQYEKPV